MFTLAPIIVTIGKVGLGVGVDSDVGVEEDLLGVGDSVSTESELLVLVGVVSSPQADIGKTNNRMKSKNL
jgi:hypothetical protein